MDEVTQSENQPLELVCGKKSEGGQQLGRGEMAGGLPVDALPLLRMEWWWKQPGPTWIQDSEGQDGVRGRWGGSRGAPGQAETLLSGG